MTIDMITRDEKTNKFYYDINGERAWIDYRFRDDKMYLMHAEVPLSFRGKGHGRDMVEAVLDLLIENNETATAVCGYIRYVAGGEEKYEQFL